MRGVLLVNLGTPDRPETPEVRRYLRQFLSDPRVIDLPAPGRWALVNLVICPFRSPKSAHAYRQVWTAEGSPLLVHGIALRDGLRTRLGPGVPVELGMRYGNPSIASAVEALVRASADEITVVPLFPQYASSSWGSAVEEVHAVTGRMLNTPSISVIPPYYDHEAFVSAQAAVAAPLLAAFRPDRVLMSYHGLPERQIRASDTSGRGACLASASCCDAMTDANRYCYRAQCYATSRALAESLSLAPGSWEVAFQSRLGRTPWIRPWTDARIDELAAKGVKRIAVLVPSFTADCLETLEEIGMRARAQFLAAGGEDLLAVPCVNASPAWVEGVARLVAPRG